MKKVAEEKLYARERGAFERDLMRTLRRGKTWPSRYRRVLLKVPARKVGSGIGAEEVLNTKRWGWRLS